MSIPLGLLGALAFDGIANLEFIFDLRFFIRWLLICVALFVAFAIMRNLIARAADDSILKSFYAGKHLEINKRWVLSLLGGTLLLCIAWIPYLIAMYPGNLYMDTSYQLVQYFSFLETGDISVLRLQHPLFDTFVFGFVIDIVYRATGDFQAGIFTLTLLQILCIAFSLSIFFNVAHKRWKIAAKPLLIVFLFVAVLPLFPVMACTISKDSFFSWSYILFFVAVLDICVCARERWRILKRTTVLLCLSAALMCLTKTTGVYVALIGILALLCVRFWKWGQRVRVVLPALFTLIIAAGIAFVFPRAFGIASGGAQEMLSVPFQQTSVVLIEHGDEIPDEDMAVIAKVIEVDTIRQDYEPFNADGVKGFSPRAATSEYMDYVGVWLRQGLRYPYEYFKAWMLLESPVFSSTTIEQIFDSSWTADDPTLPAGYNEKPEYVRESSRAVHWLYAGLCGVPLFNLLFTTYTYTIFFPMFLLLLLIVARKLRSYMPIICMLFLSLAILFVSPIAGAHFEATRYIMPFVFTTPLVVITCILAMRNHFIQQVAAGNPRHSADSVKVEFETEGLVEVEYDSEDSVADLDAGAKAVVTAEGEAKTDVEVVAVAESQVSVERPAGMGDIELPIDVEQSASVADFDQLSYVDQPMNTSDVEIPIEFVFESSQKSDEDAKEEVAGDDAGERLGQDAERVMQAVQGMLDEEVPTPHELDDIAEQSAKSDYAEAYDEVVGNVRLGAHSVVRGTKQEAEAGAETKKQEKAPGKRKRKNKQKPKKRQKAEQVSTDDVVVDFGDASDDSQG